MRKIVIPTDFSANAFSALKYAVELFKYEQSEFFLLHTYAEEVYNNESSLTKDSVTRFKAKIKKSSIEKLRDLQEEILKISPNPKHIYRLFSAFGLLVDEVNDLVNKENADIVVMGTRGKSNDRKMTFGSNALQVMKYVECPVLCIPKDGGFKPPERILFPTNYLFPYQRRELKLLAEIAKKFCAEIHLLHISRFPVTSLRQKDNLTFLKEELKQIHLEFHNRNAGNKEDAISAFIEQMKMNFLVMVSSRQTYLESMLAPSTVDKIGLNPKVPFLVLQNFHRA